MSILKSLPLDIMLEPANTKGTTSSTGAIHVEETAAEEEVNLNEHIQS